MMPPHAWFTCAAVAGPPSPLKPATPVPATVLMMPDELIFLTVLLRSTKYTLPAPSANTPPGWCMRALVARPPSPV